MKNRIIPAVIAVLLVIVIALLIWLPRRKNVETENGNGIHG